MVKVMRLRPCIAGQTVATLKAATVCGESDRRPRLT